MCLCQSQKKFYHCQAALLVLPKYIVPVRLRHQLSLGRSLVRPNTRPKSFERSNKGLKNRRKNTPPEGTQLMKLEKPIEKSPKVTTPCPGFRKGRTPALKKLKRKQRRHAKMRYSRTEMTCSKTSFSVYPCVKVPWMYGLRKTLQKTEVTFLFK